MSDPINPSYYQRGSIQVIDVIEMFNLNFCLGNAIKYLLRAGVKDQTKYAEDVRKAKWYLERQINGRYNNPVYPTIMNDMKHRQTMRAITESYSLSAYVAKAVDSILLPHNADLPVPADGNHHYRTALIAISKILEKYE